MIREPCLPDNQQLSTNSRATSQSFDPMKQWLPTDDIDVRSRPLCFHENLSPPYNRQEYVYFRISENFNEII